MRLELIWWVAFTSRPREEIPRRKVDSAKEMGVGIGHEAVAEPPNPMSPRSACFPLDPKHLKENTKLLGSVGHTPGENLKIHIFTLGSQMSE